MNPQAFKQLIGSTYSCVLRSRYIEQHKEWLKAYVTERNGQGAHDGEIGAELGLTKNPIAKIRNGLGLHAHRSIPPRSGAEIGLAVIKAKQEAASQEAANWPAIDRKAIAAWEAIKGVMVNHGTDLEPDWRCTVSRMEQVEVRMVRRRPLPSVTVAGVYGCASRMCSEIGAGRTSVW